MNQKTILYNILVIPYRVAKLFSNYHLIKSSFEFFFGSFKYELVGEAIYLGRNQLIPPIPLNAFYRREKACFFNRNVVNFIDEHRGQSPKIIGAFFMTKPIASSRVSVKPLAYFCESSYSHFLLTKTGD